MRVSCLNSALVRAPFNAFAHDRHHPQFCRQLHDLALPYLAASRAAPQGSSRVAARRLMRVSMFDRTDVRDWGCRTDRPNERPTAAPAPQRTEPKSLLLLREGLPPSCVPPRQSRLTPDPAL